MTNARDEILRRIRAGLRDVPNNEQPADVPVEREYRLSDLAPREELIERFAHRVAEYRATVHRVASRDLPEALGVACAKRGARRLVAPNDLPAAWVPAGTEILPDTELSYEQLDTADGVISGCALAIAQTGTIVLDGGAYQGRRVISLLPDYHLCIVRAEQIVGLVPEAIERLGTLASEQHRPITWISGPSATSDIELNRVEGVHGPRTLEVFIVL